MGTQYCLAVPLRFLICSLVGAGRRRASLGFPGQKDGDAGSHQHHAEHRERIAKPHHQRLALDGIAKRDNGLVACAGRVGHATGHEVIGQLRDAIAHFLAAEVDGLADDI